MGTSQPPRPIESSDSPPRNISLNKLHEDFDFPGVTQCFCLDRGFILISKSEVLIDYSPTLKVTGFDDPGVEITAAALCRENLLLVIAVKLGEIGKLMTVDLGLLEGVQGMLNFGNLGDIVRYFPLQTDKTILEIQFIDRLNLLIRLKTGYAFLHFESDYSYCRWKDPDLTHTDTYAVLTCGEEMVHVISADHALIFHHANGLRYIADEFGKKAVHMVFHASLKVVFVLAMDGHNEYFLEVWHVQEKHQLCSFPLQNNPKPTKLMLKSYLEAVNKVVILVLTESKIVHKMIYTPLVETLELKVKLKLDHKCGVLVTDWTRKDCSLFTDKGMYMIEDEYCQPGRQVLDLRVFTSPGDREDLQEIVNVRLDMANRTGESLFQALAGMGTGEHVRRRELSHQNTATSSLQSP